MTDRAEQEGGAGQIFRAKQEGGAGQIVRAEQEGGVGQIFRADTPYRLDRAGLRTLSINTPAGKEFVIPSLVVPSRLPGKSPSRTSGRPPGISPLRSSSSSPGRKLEQAKVRAEDQWDVADLITPELLVKAGLATAPVNFSSPSLQGSPEPPPQPTPSQNNPSSSDESDDDSSDDSMIRDPKMVISLLLA
ncbi:hypothetical protein Dimus_023231 [Dionaea muscipula]